MPPTVLEPVEQPAPATAALSFRQAVPALPTLIAFIFLNTVSFQIALGPPLVLVARHWGASSFYIGAITSLVSLLTLLQVYMAPRVEYIGFRQVMLMGWTGRNIMLALICLLPFMDTRFPHRFLLEALFCFIFIFNFLRGLATASWFPWISALVPQPLRGRYWSLDQLLVNLSGAVAFFFCGWMLGVNPSQFDFGGVYLVALATGWGSLYYLKNLPAPSPLPGQPVIEPILVWSRRVWRERPFRRLIRLNFMFYLFMGAWEPFTTLFMRDALGVSEGMILYISGVKTLGAVASAWAWGSLADRFGSRPVMAISTSLILATMICWLLMSVHGPGMHLFPASAVSLMILSLLFQAGFLGFVVANLRFSLNNAPKAFPVLALSLFSVMQNLANFLAPNLWGLFLDAAKTIHWPLGGFEIDRFSLFYIGMIGLLLVTKALIRRLPDQQASAPHLVLYHMMIDYPLRTVNSVYKLLFNGNQ